MLCAKFGFLLFLNIPYALLLALNTFVGHYLRNPVRFGPLFFPRGNDFRAPENLTVCKVILGGRTMRNGNWGYGLIGHLIGWGHLYLNVYDNDHGFALIEGGHIGQVVANGRLWALTKEGDWENDGVQWDITPKHPASCSILILCLKRETLDFQAANHSYHFLGPNSNSFVWWVLRKCGTYFSVLSAFYPYMGVYYFADEFTHIFPQYTNIWLKVRLVFIFKRYSHVHQPSHLPIYEPLQESHSQLNWKLLNRNQQIHDCSS